MSSNRYEIETDLLKFKQISRTDDRSQDLCMKLPLDLTHLHLLTLEDNCSLKTVFSLFLVVSLTNTGLLGGMPPLVDLARSPEKGRRPILQRLILA